MERYSMHLPAALIPSLPLIPGSAVTVPLFGIILPIVGIVIGIFATVRASKRRLNTPGSSYNPLAIVAFVLAFFISIGSIVCGHIALAQIRRGNTRGWGLAVAALWISYVSLYFAIVVIAFTIAIVVATSR